MGNYNGEERRGGERSFQIGTVWTMIMMIVFICGLIAKVVIADETVKANKEVSVENRERIEVLEKEFLEQRIDLRYI